MTKAAAIEMGMLARRERDLLLRLKNTRDRMKELATPNNKKLPSRGSGEETAGPSGPVAF